MTHEIKSIVNDYSTAKNLNLKCVLATVVHLDGSSYRRPGVRMLIREDGTMTGAVSGGCVEKEVLLQSQTVFKSGKARMMTYDGRYRLGCEGLLYILLEPVKLPEKFHHIFATHLKSRKQFSITSFYSLKEGENELMHSYMDLGEAGTHSLSDAKSSDTKSLLSFTENLGPCFKMLIIGGEHDAVALCKSSSLLGWEVTILAPAKESKIKENFPGSEEVRCIAPEAFSTSSIDAQTAILLMNHNYALDFKWLTILHKTRPAYIGLLGPSKRREKMLGDFLDHVPEAEPEFLDCVHGPAGLNIGAETPQEIAVSILSEILSVIRKQEPFHLKEKSEGIHS